MPADVRGSSRSPRAKEAWARPGSRSPCRMRLIAGRPAGAAVRCRSRPRQCRCATRSDAGWSISGRCISGRTNVAGAITRHEATGLDVLAGRSGSGALSELPAETSGVAVDPAARGTGRYDAVRAGSRRRHRSDRASDSPPWSDRLLVVATDEPTSLTDAYALLKLHTRTSRMAMCGSSSTRRSRRRPASRPMRRCGGPAWRFCTVSRRSPG